MGIHIKNLPIASDVSGTDYVVVDQGSPPVTRKATVSQVANPGGTVVFPQLTVSGQIFASFGSAAFPGIAYTNEGDTGLYCPGANTVAVTVGGVETVRFNADRSLWVNGGIYAATNTIAYTLGTDPSGTNGAQIQLTGSSYVNPNQVLINTGGATRATVNSAGVQITRSDTAFSGLAGGDPNDAFTTDVTRVISNYSLSWKTFSDDGAGGQAALSGYAGVRFYTSGTLRGRIDRTGFTKFYANLTVEGTDSGFVVNNGAGTYVGQVWNNGGALKVEAAGSAPLQFATGGSVWGTVDTDGRVSFRGLHNNGVVTGTTEQYLASGTYSPTITTVANVTTTATHQAQWMRVGNVVTVTGCIEINHTANTTYTAVGISLPLASNFTTNFQCAGTAVREGTTGALHLPASVMADASNDRAALEFYSDSDTGALRNWFYTFSYEVL